MFEMTKLKNLGCCRFDPCVYAGLISWLRGLGVYTYLMLLASILIQVIVVIVLLQKRVIRTLNRSKFGAHILILFLKELNIMKFHNISSLQIE